MNTLAKNTFTLYFCFLHKVALYGVCDRLKWISECYIYIYIYMNELCVLKSV